ncbi:MAG: transposase, partial [Bdellovibrionales bacterium]
INSKIGKLEILKEHFHRMFESETKEEAQRTLNECYEWAVQIRAPRISKYIWRLLEEERLWNYFKFKVTTSLSEGVNREIQRLQ